MAVPTPPNPKSTLYYILNGGWTAANTGDRSTYFWYASMSEKTVDLRKYDEGYIYTVDINPKSMGLSGAHTNYTDHASCRFTTKVSEAQWELIMKEANRLLIASRVTPTTYPTGAQYDLIRDWVWENPVEYPGKWGITLTVTFEGYWESKT